MSREKEAFRDLLSRIYEKTDGAELLNKKQVIEFTGMSVNTVKKHIRFNKFGKIAPADLARQLL